MNFAEIKHGTVWVSTCDNHGIERVDPKTGKTVICEGLYCQVYTDPDMTNEVDSFCLAIGHEINDLSDAEIDRGIREYLSVSEGGTT